MPVPFNKAYPAALNETILSYLHPKELDATDSSSSTSLAFQILIKNPAKKVAEENWALLVKNLRAHLQQLPDSNLKTQDNLSSKDEYHALLENNICFRDPEDNRPDAKNDVFRKAIKAYYTQGLANQNITSSQHQNDIKPEAQDHEKLYRQYNKEFIKRTIEYYCEAAPTTAGYLLADLLYQYGDYQLDISAYFVLYKANLDLDEKYSLLHIAIVKKLPTEFFTTLFEHGLLYPLNSYSSFYTNSCALKLTPITRAFLEGNQIALEFLINKYPEKASDFISYLNILNTDCVTNTKVNNHSRQYNFDSETMAEKVCMFENAIIKSYSRPNQVNKENYCAVLLMLERNLKGIKTAEQYYQVYDRFINLDYKEQILKKQIIEMIQKEIHSLFLYKMPEQFDKVSTYQLQCRVALAHDVFNPKHEHLGVNQYYRKKMHERLAEATELLEPEAEVAEPPQPKSPGH